MCRFLLSLISPTDHHHKQVMATMTANYQEYQRGPHTVTPVWHKMLLLSQVSNIQTIEMERCILK
jgi:hypothetical protein